MIADHSAGRPADRGLILSLALSLSVPLNAYGGACIDYAAEIRLATEGCTDAAGGTIFVSEGYAYVTSNSNPFDPYGSTDVLDLSDPYDPIEVDNFFFRDGEPYPYRNVSVGDGVIAATYQGDIYFSPSFDSGEPISFDSSLPLLTAGGPTEVGLGHVYVAMTPDRLFSIDVSDLGAPTFVDADSVGADGHDLLIVGDHLYMAGEATGVVVLDVSSPWDPALVTNYVIGHDVFDLSTTDGFLLASGGDRLTVLDLTDPAVPQVRGTISAGAFSGSSFGNHVSRDGIAYATTNGNVAVIDVSDPDDLSSVGTLSLDVLDGSISALGVWDETLIARGAIFGFGQPGCLEATFALGEHRMDAIVSTAGPWGGSVAVRGTHAYLRTSSSAIDIFDVSDVESPSNVGTLGGTSFQEVVSDGTRLYVTRGTAGFEIYSLSDPVNPGFLGSDAVGGALGFTVDGTLAYAADDAGFRIVDVTDGTQPTFVGGSGHGAREIIVDGGHAYLLHPDTGLRVLDVSTPALPSQVGELQLPGSPGPRHMTKVGDHLYVSLPNGNRVEAIDVSSPTLPFVSGSAALGDTPGDVDTDGDHLYVVHSVSMSVLSLADPSAPSFVGGAHARGLSRLDVEGFVFAGGTEGLMVLNPQCASATPVEPAPDPGALAAPALLRVAPLPVRTMLRIRLAGATRETARADVFDAAGRRLDTITLDRQGDGHVGEWDARAHAPGVYFIRARSAEGPVTARVVRTE